MSPVIRRRSEAARRVGRRIERPPAHWSLLALLLGSLLLLLGAQGLSTATTGRSATATTGAGDPALHGSAAIWRIEGERLVPSEAPVGRRVALTFDDGPDPRWTPRIAAVLRRLGVPATFFVVGEHVVRYPGLVATLQSDGFELGDHTFNHVDLATIPGWERHLQVSTTDTAIAGAAGVRPRFFRPPYSGGPQSISHGEAAALASTVDPGHLIVLSNYDSEDWRRPGVSTGSCATRPRPGAGAASSSSTTGVAIARRRSPPCGAWCRASSGEASALCRSPAWRERRGARSSRLPRGRSASRASS